MNERLRRRVNPELPVVLDSSLLHWLHTPDFYCLLYVLFILSTYYSILYIYFAFVLYCGV